MEGTTHFNLIADWNVASALEVAARDCFARLRVTAQEKEQNGQRILSFAIAGSHQSIKDAAMMLTSRIYNVGIQDGLKFRFDE